MTDADQYNVLKAGTIIAVDWAKNARKRSAYVSELTSRTVRRLPFDGSLAWLIETAPSFAGPVLIGIDAAIGYPAAAWHRLHGHCPESPRTFADFLLNSSLPAAFFEPVARPEEWSPQRPFIRPGRGRWSLDAFNDASSRGLYRQIDRRLHANPMFVTSGLPGTVGSGTRALWQELTALGNPAGFRVWPFHGSLPNLLTAGVPVVAEIYPKACYGIALSDTLPAPLRSIGKTKEAHRQQAISTLRAGRWLARAQLAIADIDAALANEDDFDALLSAVALTRIWLENASFENPDTIDDVAEGGVLGAASLTLTASGQRAVSDSVKRTRAPRPAARRVASTYPCPIPGCAKVFHNSRGGWDAHVGAVSRHPQWYPEIADPEARKALFRQLFPIWFC